MSVKVVDWNETAKEKEPTLQPTEEATEEQQQPEIINEVVEEVKVEEPKEQVKETPKPKPKPEPKPRHLVSCPDCSRTMTYKKLRYSHKCSPEPPPVKKQAHPKCKAKPELKQPPEPHEVTSKQRVPPGVYYTDSDDEEPQQQFIKKEATKAPSTTNI